MPEDYLAKAERVMGLFLHQTVYCPTKQRLVQLNEAKDLSDIEYFGSHGPLEANLGDYVLGNLVRGTQELRQCHMGQKVIDMNKLRMDFFRNDIGLATLRILDPSYFRDASIPEKPRSAWKKREKVGAE